MNLGDGLKLETELLDGKTKLILASYERKPKTATKMGNKAKIPKQPLRTPQTGHILKSTQNTDGRNESLLQKSRTASDTSLAKGDKGRMIFSPATSFSKEDTHNDHLCVQRNIPAETPDSWRTKNYKQPAGFTQKPQKKHLTVENLRNSLVCLTEEQLQQILMAVSQGNRSMSQTENGKKEEKCQNNLHFNNFPNESKDENIMGLLQKAENVSLIPDENNSILNKKQKTSKHCEQKIAIKSVWKPADMFSTLGEREREKSLLEAKKFQWRKELDEQVALKKKEKEAFEEQKKCPWGPSGDTKLLWDDFQAVGGSQSSMSPSSILSRSPNPRLAAHPGGDSVPGTSHALEMTSPAELNSAAEDTQDVKNVSRAQSSEVVPTTCCGPWGKPSTFSSPDLPAAIRTAFVLGEATPREHPFSAVKKEQRKKWMEELNKQKEEDKQRKLQEKMTYSKGEEHDRWAMHFDSLKLYPSSQSQLSSRATQKQPDYFCLSPDTQEMTDVSSPYTPLSGSQLGPSEENFGKSVQDTAAANPEKTNFLRSMTALLDPAQIEERDRRRQKQLEHQKAITAQVEEKRREKQLQEQQRRREEEEEERRLAREREELQRRFEEDLLQQKCREEMMTLKTHELYQTMQKAQEQAQRLKQEQRLRELGQKGHDISNLLRALGGDVGPAEQSLGMSSLSHSRQDFSDQLSTKVSQGITTTSPRKDTAVQTDDLHAGSATSAETHTQLMTQGTHTDLSPEISLELDRQFNSKKSKKEVLPEDKKASLEKENSRLNDLYDQFARTEKQTKNKGKCTKRPDWNINKPTKRYVPASERYPKHLQRQREEKKIRRQMELLQLLERSTPGRLSVPRDVSPEGACSPHEETDARTRGWGPRGHKEEELKKINSSKERSESPPVPAVKNRLQHTQLKQTHAVHAPEPPHFVPYVRTNEIYCLDPDAPSSRPSGYDPQNPYLNDSDYREQIIGPDNVRDPLLNPNLVKNRDRQQAILKGLSDLRQGLLQKQKELETHLIPLASNQEDFDSPF